MGEMWIVASVPILVIVALGSIFTGLVLIYASARLIATAWFKTKREHEQEQGVDEDGVPVSKAGRKERGSPRFAVG